LPSATKLPPRVPKPWGILDDYNFVVQFRPAANVDLRQPALQSTDIPVTFIIDVDAIDLSNDQLRSTHLSWNEFISTIQNDFNEGRAGDDQPFNKNNFFCGYIVPPPMPHHQPYLREIKAKSNFQNAAQVLMNASWKNNTAARLDLFVWSPRPKYPFVLPGAISVPPPAAQSFPAADTTVDAPSQGPRDGGGASNPILDGAPPAQPAPGALPIRNADPSPEVLDPAAVVQPAAPSIPPSTPIVLQQPVIDPAAPIAPVVPGDQTQPIEIEEDEEDLIFKKPAEIGPPYCGDHFDPENFLSKEGRESADPLPKRIDYTNSVIGDEEFAAGTAAYFERLFRLKSNKYARLVSSTVYSLAN
jgi:hypothetical protein